MDSIRHLLSQVNLIAEAEAIAAQSNARKMAVELQAIAPVDEVTPQGRFALIQCPSLEAVRGLVEAMERISEIASEYWFDCLLLAWPNCPQPLPIPSSQQQRHVERPTPQQSNKLFIPELSLGFDDFWNNEKPLYINDFNKVVVFANQAALRAQSKTRSQFFGESVYLLNYHHELDERVERIEDGEILENYEYRAMRWFVDDQGQHRRKQMNFSSNFGKVWFAEEWHWYSAPQQAMETGVII